MLKYTLMLQDSMLHDFSTYLQSFMGGAIRKDLSDKHRSNASQVWDVFNPITDSPNALAESIEQQLKTDVWKPNTARTYLNSFKMLLTFIGSMSLIGQKDYTFVDAGRLNIIKDQVGRISTTLSSLAARTRKSIAETQDNVINPEDLKQYLDSKRANEAEQALISGGDGTRSTHSLVRNGLLMRLATSNAHRTACLSNMLVSEFENAQVRNKNYIVNVHQHKTSKTSKTFGPAEVIMDENLHSDISTYLKSVRPKCGEHEVFVSWNGKSMDSLLVLHCFAVELAHAGVEKR